MATLARSFSVVTLALTAVCAGSSTLSSQGSWRYERVVAERIGQSFAWGDGVAVLAAGGGDYCERNDCWEWDARRWTNTPDVTSYLRGGAMAYDEARGEFVLFGGNVGDFWLDETRVRRQHQWSLLRPATRPAARTFASLAYDKARQRVVLFGGRDFFGTWLNDTWEWDGTSWTARAVAPPAQTFADRTHLCYDPQRQVVLLNTGTEIYRWDGVAWTREGSSPGHGSIVFDAVANRLVLIRSNGATHVRSGGGFSLLTSSLALGYQDDPLLAYDEVRGRVLLYSGRDLYALQGASWQLETPNTHPPEGRIVDEFVAYDAQRGRIVYAAGLVWEWDGEHWTSIEPASGRRSGNAMVYDTLRRRVVLLAFEGQFAWTGSDWQRVSTARSPSLNMAAYDARRDRILMVHESLHYEWDGFSWTSLPGPSAPRGTATSVAYDHARGVTVLFTMAGIWELSGGQWTKPFSGPSPFLQWQASTTYDPVRGRIVVAGGTDGQARVQTNEWDGTSWQSGPNLPYPLESAGLGYDTARQRMVLFGGEDFFGACRYGDTLSWARDELSADTRTTPGGTVTYALSLPAAAGQTFAVGLSFSTTPGLPLTPVAPYGTIQLPLALDPLLLGTLGRLFITLDGSGNGATSLPIPPSPVMIDAAWYGAALTYGAGSWSVTREAYTVVRR